MSKDITDSINSDPLLYNLFSNNTKDDFKNSRPVNWIKIPTSYLTEDGKDSSISMLSVYTYSAEESQNIYASISQPDGDDIVFSEDGHVACDFKKAKTKAEYFYPNPVVTPPSVSTRPDDISNTVGKFTRDTNFSPSFYFSEKFLFSKNLLWILYQLPDKFYNKNGDTYEMSSTKKDDSIPVYVLLYNTVHRQNFQVIYGKILNDDNNAFSTKPYIGSNTGYSSTITKYCNAFRTTKYVSPISGEELDHYGDPSCEFSFNRDMAVLALSFSLNLTQDSWKNKFFKDKEAYSSKLVKLTKVPESEAYCSRGQSGGPSRFIREIAKIVEAKQPTNSFMQILTNYKIAESGEDAGASYPVGYNDQLPSGYEPVESTNFKVLGVTCGERNVSIVDCSININSQTGDISLNKTNISNQCGNVDDPSKTPSDPSKTPSDPSKTPSDPSKTPSDPSKTPDDPSKTPSEMFSSLEELLPMIIFLILMIIAILVYIFVF